MAEDSVAQDQIKAFVDRILRLKEESKAIASDIREIYAEAKGNGFDKTVLGKLVNYVEKRQSNSADLEEGEALFDLYLTAYDGASRSVGTKRATHTHASESTDPDADEVVAQKARLAALRADPAMAIVGAADLKKPEHPSNMQKVHTAPAETQPAPQAGSDLTNPAPLNGQVASNSDIGNPISNEAPMAVDGDSVEAATAPLSESVDILPGGVQLSKDGRVDASPAASNPDADKSVGASASAAPLPIKYAAPGVITWEVAPPEGVQRHDFSAAFGDLGQDLVVIGDEIASARAEPIVKIGNVILDGWARYMVARGAIGLDGHSTEYSVVQYDGADPLMDCIKWNLAGRILNETQKRLIAQRLAKLQPKRKNDIYAAMDMGMELVS